MLVKKEQIFLKTCEDDDNDTNNKEYDGMKKTGNWPGLRQLKKL